ncbi:hypothetical protein G7Y89_g10922 [Cudoniella acicularis]|uniref:Uncharacterized protein n=1 Tax=Cudoniella acicularis TaxID=354080 RepID=A0A8H4RBT2_9HELO|nr:hypothetical protein G7Y89_g10922 [Cudoniella acicularis]
MSNPNRKYTIYVPQPPSPPQLPFPSRVSVFRPHSIYASASASAQNYLSAFQQQQQYALASVSASQQHHGQISLEPSLSPLNSLPPNPQSRPRPNLSSSSTTTTTASTSRTTYQSQSQLPSQLPQSSRTRTTILPQQPHTQDHQTTIMASSFSTQSATPTSPLPAHLPTLDYLRTITDPRSARTTTSITTQTRAAKREGKLLSTTQKMWERLEAERVKDELRREASRTNFAAPIAIAEAVQANGNGNGNGNRGGCAQMDKKFWFWFFVTLMQAGIISFVAATVSVVRPAAGDEPAKMGSLGWE